MNPSFNVYQSYQKTNIETASPEKLILMLYDGMIRFLGQAKLRIQEKNIEESHRLLVKAQAIISELTMSLKPEAGGEVARNLSGIYTYMYGRLIEANMSKDAGLVQEVIDLATPLRDAWVVAMAKKAEGMQPAQPGMKPAV